MCFQYHGWRLKKMIDLKWNLKTCHRIKLIHIQLPQLTVSYQVLFTVGTGHNYFWVFHPILILECLCCIHDAFSYDRMQFCGPIVSSHSAQPCPKLSMKSIFPRYCTFYMLTVDVVWFCVNRKGNHYVGFFLSKQKIACLWFLMSIN
jgi:hypothetical protein